MSKALCLSGMVGLVTLGLVMMPSLAMAGPLATHPNAYFDGSITWRGTAPFDSDGIPGNGSLEGYVDWAVFAVGDFPYLGYAPTPAEFAYAYQVYVTGPPPVTFYSIPLDNPADNIGSFADLPGAVPINMTLVPPPLGSATWDFAGIGAGGNSEGLAFSSTQLPEFGYSLVINTGLGAYVFPNAVPGPSPIPEPASVLMAAVALGLARTCSRRR